MSYRELYDQYLQKQAYETPEGVEAYELAAVEEVLSGMTDTEIYDLQKRAAVEEALSEQRFALDVAREEQNYLMKIAAENHEIAKGLIKEAMDYVDTAVMAENMAGNYAGPGLAMPEEVAGKTPVGDTPAEIAETATNMAAEDQAIASTRAQAAAQTQAKVETELSEADAAGSPDMAKEKEMARQKLQAIVAEAMGGMAPAEAAPAE